MTTRSNQWFVPGAGIAREVITADIQRYLGNDALVRPGIGTGEYQGQHGYWITAYRTLTTNMIEDLKNDSLRWQQERPSSSVREYQDSQTHRSRQHYGPSAGFGPAAPYEQYGGPAYEDPRGRGQTTAPRPGHTTAPGYGGNNEAYYVTTPTQPYQNRVGYGQTAPNSATPRTQPVDAYAAYQQTQAQPGAQQTTRTDYNPSPYATYQTGGTEAYGRPTQAPGTAYTPPSDPNSDWYIASDGRRYPRSMQPQVGRK